MKALVITVVVSALALMVYMAIAAGGQSGEDCRDPASASHNMQIDVGVAHDAAVDSTTTRAGDLVAGKRPETTAVNSSNVGREALVRLGSSLGLEVYAPLSQEEKARIVERLGKELAGAFSYVDSIDKSDAAAAARAMVAVLKIRQAIEMMERDEYITIDATALPRTSVPGIDPMILPAAARLGARRVGILIPIKVASGGDIDAATQVAEGIARDRIAAIVASFNSLPRETRMTRIKDMEAAQAENNAVNQASIRGEISVDELARRMEELRPRLVPKGTWIDRVEWILRY